MNIPSLLRVAEHQALHSVTLSGKVLDIGGDARSEYLSYIKGSFSVTRLNQDTATQPDIVHDAEKPLPIEAGSYDGAVLFNILEHIFHYRELLQETQRVLVPSGTVLVVVPFLFPVHPSPDDFRRFSSSALRRELVEAGFTNVVVQALGKGVWSARYLLLDRLLPFPIRLVSFYTLRYAVYVLDGLTVWLSRALHKQYDPAHYALGFCVTATKP